MAFVPWGGTVLAGRSQRVILESALGGAIPEPVLIGVAVVVGTAIWLAAMYVAFRLAFRVWKRIKPRVTWAVGLVLPESPVVKFAVGLMVLIAFTIGIVGVLPAFLGDLSEADEGAASYVNRMSDTALNGDWNSIVDGDAVGGEPACRNGHPSLDGGATDADGDGIPDAWERAGETPDGARLPGADPSHKDLYVQLNYGEGIERLTETERSQLVAAWDRMPVENPDGASGIDVHLVERPADGRLDEPATVTRRESYNDHYTDEYLGPRKCVYRQVTYGRLQVGNVAGLGSASGYAAAVDGARQPAYDGNVSFRVAVTTHELLHTTAGRVDGQPHTTEGWLKGGSDDEFLAAATARDLNESGLYGPAA
ncbi:hypothetical protein ACKVMT_06770 [Halobacteriales archaeon Cl-PHB]